MDETGFRIGVGKGQLIIARQNGAHYFGIPENRESATVVETISAAFLILSRQMHVASWYYIPELEPDTAIRPASTGNSNDEIILEWLRHFEKRSAKTSKRLISRWPRTHYPRQFVEYCDEHDIIPFSMPPNLTHVLQLLDVAVFQPLKHYRSQALGCHDSRRPLVNIAKLEFLSCIQQVRSRAFKPSTIRSTFRKRGVWPSNPEVVLQLLEARQGKKTPTPPTSDSCSSPFQTPFNYSANK